MSISENLRDKFKEAKRVCVLTGAGISAESGVPTFRGGGGSTVWRGLPFEQLSSAQMVKENLKLVWDWFDYRREVLKDCKPNPAHHVLSRWDDKTPEFLLVTQNIDGLHAQAGSRRLLELHGNIQRSRCTKCGLKYEMLTTEIPHEPDECYVCDSPVRPDVVLFGEMLPEGYFEFAVNSAQNAELFVSIGTSAVVYPAAGLMEIAREAGAFTVEINPEITPLSENFDESLRGTAGEILPDILGIKDTRYSLF